MTGFLVTVAAVLAAAGMAGIVLLAVRRVLVARTERRAAALEGRLRLLALDLLDGDEDATRFALKIRPREARALGRVLVRYGRQLRGTPQEHLGAFFALRGFDDEAVRRLRARSPWRRAAAAAALGDMGARAATNALVEVLEDPDRDVRAAAARSLGRLGAVEAAPALVRAFASGAVSRVTAGQALLALGPLAVDAVRPMLSSDEGPVRATAIEITALAGGGGGSATLVAQRLRDPSAEVRAAACRALGRLGAAEAAGGLRETLDDRIPFVRAAAAEALGQLGAREAITALAIQAHRDSFEPAEAAARALGRIAPVAASRAAAAPGAGPHLVFYGDLTAVREAA